MNPRMNPFTELGRFFDQLGAQFERASDELEASEPFARLSLGLQPMAVDVIDRTDAYVVHADLPGFERDDVEVRVTEHTLHIDAEREETREDADEADGRYIRRERRDRPLSRSIQLRDDVDPEQVEAKMKNGMLTVTIPKLEPHDEDVVSIEVS